MQLKILNMEEIDLKKIRRNIFGIPSTRNVCRSLFGEVDHDQVKQDLDREYKETLEQKAMLWNFDFDKYCPMKNCKTGLSWTPELAPVSEHVVKPGNTLVTMFERLPCLGKQQVSNIEHNKTKSTTSERQQQDCKQACITDFVTSTNKNKKRTIAHIDEDETNVIEIITESPTRNVPNLRQVTTEEPLSAIKLDISEDNNKKTHARRKRGFQPTIDDFMKKKKSRANVDFASSSKKPNSPRPIARRLRSSPAVKIHV